MEEKFIEVKQLYKTFHTKKQTVEVLKGIDLLVEKGEIYGIVGFSGAGKSTLVRCINRLEEPDSGSVRIGDKEITSLGKKELNAQRRKIGMIFQQFNLFDSMTVAQNIAYSLKMTGTPSKEAYDKQSGILQSLLPCCKKRQPDVGGGRTCDFAAGGQPVGQAAGERAWHAAFCQGAERRQPDEGRRAALRLCGQSL